MVSPDRTVGGSSGGSPMSRMVRNALRMTVGTLASRVLGLVREMITAAVFGATRQLDSFYVAYTLANLARQLLAEGALSAAFVPVFSRVLKDRGREEAARLARQASAVLMAGTMLVVLLGMAGAGLLVRVMAPGFSPEDRLIASRLTAALFPFLMFMSLGALAMGVLNSLDRFFVPAVAPALSNLVFIVCVWSFYPTVTVWHVVAAVLMGGLSQMVLQWVWSYRCGIPLSPSRPDMGNSDLRRMMRLFLPYAAGLSLNQLNPVVSRFLASYLEGGAISALNYADRVLQLPLGLFVVAIAQAVLPALSRLDPWDREGFRVFLRDSLRFNLFAVLPVSLGLVMFARPVTHLIFFRGAFGQWALDATSGALRMYGVGLAFMSCNAIVMRALYARGLARGAMTVTAVTVLCNLAFGYLLMARFSYSGLALGTSLAFLAASMTGMAMVSRDLGAPLGMFELKWVLRQGIPLASMGAALVGFSSIWSYPYGGALGGRLCWFALCGLTALGVYLGVALGIGMEELKWLKLRGRRVGTGV
ncbi:integral membrane protein MviN [Thermanaerovibrio velox DSM 12556]|uniref:Probable lipid II flippase MurJ n=1 Tax=Thermanaerovibrio velox DSM 12556 TaxID=926567 RepID=H0UQD6_9BACT|nr:murein biosynthesis integral membrane protein MurJ [Thermanaerovibrio velox]EHM09690.1 integral membrane protein MviN [Thermanaerovibrio velox DSM 12556]